MRSRVNIRATAISTLVFVSKWYCLGQFLYCSTTQLCFRKYTQGSSTSISCISLAKHVLPKYGGFNYKLRMKSLKL